MPSAKLVTVQAGADLKPAQHGRQAPWDRLSWEDESNHAMFLKYCAMSTPSETPSEWITRCGGTGEISLIAASDHWAVRKQAMMSWRAASIAVTNQTIIGNSITAILPGLQSAIENVFAKINEAGAKGEIDAAEMVELIDKGAKLISSLSQLMSSVGKGDSKTVLQIANIITPAAPKSSGSGGVSFSEDWNHA